MIDLPQRALQTITDDRGRVLVRDPVRRQWVRLTPEEEVRQQLLLHLVDSGFPVGLLAVERVVPYRGKIWRADIVAFDRQQQPLLLAECKAPSVPIAQDTFDQLARYNASLDAMALLATNGPHTLLCLKQEKEWHFVDSLPHFSDLAHRN